MKYKLFFIMLFLSLLIFSNKPANAQLGYICALDGTDPSCFGWYVTFRNNNPGTNWEVRYRHEWLTSLSKLLEHTVTKSVIINSGDQFKPAPISTDYTTYQHQVHWATTCADPLAVPFKRDYTYDEYKRLWWDIDVDPVPVPGHVGNGDNLGTVTWTGSTAEGNFTSGSKAQCYQRYSCSRTSLGSCVRTNCDPNDNNCFSGPNAAQCGEPNAADRCEGPISGQVFLPNGTPLNGARVDRNGANAQDTRNISGVNGSFRWGGLNLFSNHTVRLIRSSYDQCAYDIADNTRNVEVINNDVNFRLDNVLYNINARAVWDAEANGIDAGDPNYNRNRITFTTDPGGRDCSTTDGTCTIGGNPTDPGGRSYDIRLSGVQTGDFVYSNNPATRNIVCSGVGVNFAIAKGYQISGSIYNDLNFNQRRNPALGENLYTRSNTVTLQGQGSRSSISRTQTVNDGTYLFSNLPTGTYTVTIDDTPYDPAGYLFSTPRTYTVTVAPGNSCRTDNSSLEDSCVTTAPWGGSIQDLNFGITPIYSVSGGVFEDLAPFNDVKDANEDFLPGQSIAIRQGGANVPNNPPFASANPQNTTNSGYRFENILQGAYRVVYFWTYNIYEFFDSYFPSAAPGTNPFFQLNLDRPPLANCIQPDNTGPDCAAFGVTNLNFALRRITQQPYLQTFGGDVRLDNGFTNSLPNNRNFSGNLSGNPRSFGIIFGNNGVTKGRGDYNPSGWFVDDGGIGSAQVKLSYSYLKSSIENSGNANKIIKTVRCTRCSISNFPVTGETTIYELPGNVTFEGSFDIPANRNYIFLVPGNLNINTDIRVPKGSTATFAARGQITIAGNVRELQGILSSGGNFTFATQVTDPVTGVTPDTPIRVEGVIITDVGSRIIRDRKLTPRESRDGWNGQPGPTATIEIYYRPDFVLNVPAIIRTALSKRIEVIPGQ